MTERVETGLAEPCATETRILSRQTLLLAILLAELVPLAIWSVVLCHEVLGHLLMAVLCGGTVRGVHVDLRGTAVAFFALPDGTSQLARILVHLSGTSVTLILGILAALVSQRINKHPVAAFFCILFALCGTMSALIYATFGLGYGMGDFAFVVHPMFFRLRVLAFATGLGVFVAAFLLMRTYASLQMRWFPISSGNRRVALAALTLGFGFVAFGLVTLFSHLAADVLSLNAAKGIGFAVDAPEFRVQIGERVLPLSAACVLIAVSAGIMGLLRGRKSPFQVPDWLRVRVLALPALLIAGYVLLVSFTGGDGRVSGPSVYKGRKQDALLTRKFEMRFIEPDGHGRLCFCSDGEIDVYDPRSGQTTPLLSDVTRPMALHMAGSRLYFAEFGLVRYVNVDTGERATVLTGGRCSAFYATESGDLYFAEYGRSEILLLPNQASEPRHIAQLPEAGGDIEILARFPSGDLLAGTEDALFRISQDGADVTKIDSDISDAVKVRFIGDDCAVALDWYGHRLMALEFTPSFKEYDLITSLFDSRISSFAVGDNATIFYAGDSSRPLLPSPYFLRVLKIEPASSDRSVRSDGS